MPESKSTNTNDYVWKYAPDEPGVMSNGMIYMHRYVMQHYLGRPLKENELVMHKDGNKENNKIQNLILMKFDENGNIVPVNKKKRKKNSSISTVLNDLMMEVEKL